MPVRTLCSLNQPQHADKTLTETIFSQCTFSYYVVAVPARENRAWPVGRQRFLDGGNRKRHEPGCDRLSRMPFSTPRRYR